MGVVATPAQETIVWGSHFARIVPERFCVEFGRVANRDEFTPDRWPLFDDAKYADGWRPCLLHLPGDPGMVGVRHISTLRPLTADQYADAEAVGWDTGRMEPKLLIAVFTDPAWEGDRS